MHPTADSAAAAFEARAGRDEAREEISQSGYPGPVVRIVNQLVENLTSRAGFSSAVPSTRLVSAVATCGNFPDFAKISRSVSQPTSVVHDPALAAVKGA